MIKKHFPESELIVNSDGSIFHIHLLPEQLTDNIIVVGDPNRVNMVAAHFDTRDFEVSSREFHTIGGSYHGKPIMCLSHGIGSDNIDIVINELDALANIDLDSRTTKDKFRQLNDSLYEDFQREEVLEKANGIIFGNPQRLSEPNKRTLTFTEKCINNARREKVGLVLTMDLFKAAKRVADTGDEEYARKCRQAIKEQLGEVVVFPEE